MASRIQIRRDYANNWKTNNPILSEGELGYELDTKKLKVGDGVSSWNILNYFLETIDYSAIVDAPTVSRLASWDTAYKWGDHSVAGYLLSSTASTTYQPLDADLTAISSLPDSIGFLRKTGNDNWEIDTTTYLTTNSDAAKVTSSKLANWDNAYNWGDHSAAGYLTSYEETDPIFTASPAATITSTQMVNWNQSYSWGDHSVLGYAKISNDSPPSTPNSPGVTGTILRDNLFLYVCVDTDTWVRTELISW